MKKRLVLLVLLLMLLLTGCRRYSGFLPYAREIEDMELIRTLGVDTAGDAGVAITASGGTSQEETEVVAGEAGTISAAVLELQGEGSSYLYFGHAPGGGVLLPLFRPRHSAAAGGGTGQTGGHALSGLCAAGCGDAPGDRPLCGAQWHGGSGH